MRKKESPVTASKMSPPLDGNNVPKPNAQTPPAAKDSSFGSRNDLEDLREIFWGNHIRTTEGRFNTLEANLDTVNRTLSDTFSEKLSSLGPIGTSQSCLSQIHPQRAD